MAANALADGGVDGRRSKWSVANGLGGARPPDRSRPLPTMRRGGDRLRMSVDRGADVHGGPVAVGRGTRWVSHRYWSKISLAFACAFARIWDAEAKTAAASLCLNPGWFGKALQRKSPTRQRWRALMASARGAVSAPLQLAAAWWLRTRVRPSSDFGRGLRTRTSDADFGRGLRTRTSDADFGRGLRTRTSDADFGRGLRTRTSDADFGRGLRTRTSETGTAAVPASGAPICRATHRHTSARLPSAVRGNKA